MLSPRRRAVPISDEAAADALNRLLDAGWYIECIGENDLGYLVVPLDTPDGERRVSRGMITPYDDDVHHRRALVVVITEPGAAKRHRQRVHLSDCAGGTLDAEVIGRRAAALFPGWSVALSARLNRHQALNLPVVDRRPRRISRWQ